MSTNTTWEQESFTWVGELVVTDIIGTSFALWKPTLVEKRELKEMKFN